MNMRGLCLLDGDNRNEPDGETAKAGLEVLRRRRYEIENYLLQPDAIARFTGFPLTEPQVRQAFAKQVPQSTDLFGDHVSLVRVKAGDEFLLPLLRGIERSTPKRDLYLLAAEMREDEIHPEVREKLDRIAEALAPA